MTPLLKIRAERRRRGWNQQQLGVRAGIQAADICRIETGRLVPYPAQAARLAKVLGLQPNELQAVTTEDHDGPTAA